MPGELRDAVVAERLVDQAGRHEHRRLRRGVGDRLQHAARQRAATLERRHAGVESEREHQEEITDLRDRRVRDQQLEPLLPQRDHVADEDRRRAQRREQLRGRRGHDPRQHVEPEPHDEEPRPLDHQPRQHRARRGRRAGVRRRQPEMQREERGLGEQSRRHQRCRRERRGFGADPLGQQLDVQRAVRAVHQHDAEEIEDRAEQRVQQVAERGAQCLGLAVERNERDGSESQELERDVQREEIAAHEHEVQRAPDGEQERPEDERRPCLPHPGGRAEIGARVHADPEDHHRDRGDHDERQAVRAQRDAERRRPAAEEIGQRLARLHHRRGDRDRDAGAREDRDRRDPLRVASAERERGEHADERHHHRQHEQEPARRRRHLERRLRIAGSVRPGRRRRIGGQRDRVRLVGKAEQQRDRERGR